MSEKDRIRLCGLIHVEGIHSYQSLVGERTVRAIRFLNQKDIDEKEAQEREAEFRRWTSASKSFYVEARFDDFKDGLVVLEKRDGTFAKVPPSSLTAEDQKHYRDILRERVRSRPKRR